MNKKIKNIIKCSIVVVCLMLFWMIFNSVLKTGTWLFDEPINTFINKFFNPILTTFCLILARIGGRAGTAILTIVLCIISTIKFKNKKMAIIIVINIFLIGLFNHFIKEYVQRLRPEYRMMDVAGYSFPSGHSMVSAAFYGFLIYLIYKNVKNKYVKYFSIIGLSLLVILIGISRIYLGVHYTSDVIAGFLISISYLIIFTSVI